MGFFDDIRKALGAGRDPRAPEQRGPHEATLKAAQRKRRAGGVERASSKRASEGKIGSYERLERQLALALGKFPWTSSEARDALRAKGFDPAHAEAYLRSPAARKLLEGER